MNEMIAAKIDQNRSWVRVNKIVLNVFRMRGVTNPYQFNEAILSAKCS